MSASTSPGLAQPPASPPPGNPAAPPSTAAARDAWTTTVLVVGAFVAGAVLQIWVPPGPMTGVAATGIASLVVLGLAFAVPGRLRATLSGFRFTSTLLIALAIFAILGTLILQGKPVEVYRSRYAAVAPLILALRLDDIFHGLPFAGLTALFGAAIIASASLRWPITPRRAGFFVAHLGLLATGFGAGLSSVYSVRGRVDLFTGGDVTDLVRVTRSGGVATGALVHLPFSLKLDQFDLVDYETEYRVGYYKRVRILRDGVPTDDYRLATSFDPDLAPHRLPDGDSFRLVALYPDLVTREVAVAAAEGPPALRVEVDGEEHWLAPGQRADSADGQVAILLGVARPAPAPGVATSVLISAADRTVTVHRADGEATAPVGDRVAILGDRLRIGPLLDHARREAAYATRSAEWRDPAALIETAVDGRRERKFVRALQPRGVFVRDGQGALVFERRDREVKAFLSHVAARDGAEVEHAVISVNDPFVFHGWTLYQVNYDPNDPNYSGLEAVHDPGVRWVFGGFVLICLGVFYMFYVEPRLRGGGIERPPAPPAAV